MSFNDYPLCRSFQLVDGVFYCPQFDAFLSQRIDLYNRGELPMWPTREKFKQYLFRCRVNAQKGECPFAHSCPLFQKQVASERGEVIKNMYKPNQNKSIMYKQNNYYQNAPQGGGYGYGRGGYSRGGGWSGRSSGYGRGGYSRPTSWPKGKKNSNAWVRIIDTDGGKAAIGGAWLYDFYKKALFKVDITPKYSRKTGDGGFERVEPSYETQDGRIRYKVKCSVTNKNTMQVFHDTGFYNPDSGKVYFERIDLLVNFNKRTACFSPLRKEYRTKGY